MAGVFESIGGLAGAVILLMVFLVVIAYMVSKFLKLPQLEVFSKIELYEVFISVLILISAQGIFLFSGELSSAIAGGDTFDIARGFHSRIMIQGLFPAIAYCQKMIVTFSILNTFQIRPNDSVWTWTYKVAPGADTIVGMFNLLIYGLILVMGTINAHIFILAFIEATMANFFLPAGVLLRFFPPTRQAGVFIITASIAFYAVYPTFYAISIQTLDEIAQMEGDDYFDPFPELYAEAVSYGALASPFIISGLVAGVAGSPLLDFLPAGVKSTAESFLGFLASEAFIMILQPELFAPIIRSIASLSLATFFIPAMSLIVTIAFINGVTNFIDRKIT